MLVDFSFDYFSGMVFVVDLVRMLLGRMKKGRVGEKGGLGW